MLNRIVAKDTHAAYVDLEDPENDRFRLSSGILHLSTTLSVFYELDVARADCEADELVGFLRRYQRVPPPIERSLRQLIGSAYARLIFCSS